MLYCRKPQINELYLFHQSALPTQQGVILISISSHLSWLSQNILFNFFMPNNLCLKRQLRAYSFAPE